MKSYLYQCVDREYRPNHHWTLHGCWYVPLLSLLLVAATCCSTAQPFPQLTHLYQVKEAQADFIFVFDTSGSMQPFFERVRSACIDFLRSLPPEDRIFLIRFASSAQQLAPDGVPAKEYTQLEEVLPQAPSPAPEGDWTDIGRALEEVLALLNRQDARPLACVVFLTDGVHNPPANSVFPRNVDAGRWIDLKRQAREVVRTKQFFRAFGIGLQRRTDVSLLSQVFGDEYSTLLPASPQQLRATFDEIKQELLRERLRQLVQTELSRDSLRWSKGQAGQVYNLRRGGHLQLNYRLSSGFTVLPVRWQLSNEHRLDFSPAAEGIDPAVLSTSLQVTPSEGTLNPGQSVDIQVRLIFPAQGQQRLKLASRTTHTLRVTLPYTAYAEPKEEIEQLQLSPNVRVLSEQGEEIPSAFYDTVQVVVEEGEPISGLILRWLPFPIASTIAAAVLWHFTPVPFGYLVVQPRRSYPLRGQAKAKSRWMVQLLFICAAGVMGAAVGTVGGLLAGSWLMYYLGATAGAILGLAAGWLRWGRKEVIAGGMPICDIYLKEAHNAAHFFVRQGQVYYYSSDNPETKPLSDGSEVVLTGVQAVWRERYS